MLRWGRKSRSKRRGQVASKHKEAPNSEENAPFLPYLRRRIGGFGAGADGGGEVPPWKRYASAQWEPVRAAAAPALAPATAAAGAATAFARNASVMGVRARNASSVRGFGGEWGGDGGGGGAGGDGGASRIGGASAFRRAAMAAQAMGRPPQKADLAGLVSSVMGSSRAGARDSSVAAGSSVAGRATPAGSAALAPPQQPQQAQQPAAGGEGGSAVGWGKVRGGLVGGQTPRRSAGGAGSSQEKVVGAMSSS